MIVPKNRKGMASKVKKQNKSQKISEKPYHFLKCEKCNKPFLIWKNDDPVIMHKNCKKCR